MAGRIHIACLLVVLCPLVQCETLWDLINKMPDLSKIAEIIRTDDLVKLQFQRTPYTAFMPNNDAMENITKDDFDLDFISAHITKTPMLIQKIPDTVTTDMTGNPDLYVTRIPNGKRSITGWGDNDFYVNNAKVVMANQRAVTSGSPGQEQILHVIDRVLPPLSVSGAAKPPIRGYPSAADLLLHHAAYGLTGSNNVKGFKDRVEALGQMDVFRTPGKNTFFIAVDKALSGQTSQVLDQQVIHGHVIPGHALFTRPASVQSEETESLAFTDNLKVLLKLVNVSDANDAYYVTSNTVAADRKHAQGSAMARLVRANIPVSNGVVHLIDRPLMTTAESIISYLKEEGGQLSEFYKLFNEHQKDLLEELKSRTSANAVTIFAPSNYAFSMVKKERLNEVALNSAKLAELLKLHIVPRRLTTEEILASSTGQQMYQSNTMSRDRKLYFDVNTNDPSKQPVVSVEGAGVNASIETPNIVAKNGIIHIIDRIMDIPSQTVFEKIRSNPSMSITYDMSSQDGFNEQFKDRSQKFTLFVPSNDAWARIKREMVSSYKKLTMGDFPYHVRTILERHLIVGKDLPINALSALTNNRTLSPNEAGYQDLLEMTRGKVHFKPRVTTKGNEYALEWNGIVANVIQSDMECVNGVVHIIDKVLMLREDVTVAASATTAAATLLVTAVTVAMTALLR